MTRKNLINLLWLVVVLFITSGCAGTEVGEEIGEIITTNNYKGDENYTNEEGSLNHYMKVEADEKVDKTIATSNYEESKVNTNKENILYHYFEAQIGEGTNDAMTMISAGVGRSFAIHSDGSLWAWGTNWKGGLGDGTTENRCSPVKIMDDAIAVSAEWYRSWAIKSDGSLWGWGDISELIGEASDTYQPSPIKIMEDVVAISSALNSSLVKKEDGNIWTVEYEPTKVMEDVTAISVGGINYTLAIRSDGSLWAWGSMAVEAPPLDQSYYPNIFHIESPIKIMEDVIAVSIGGNRAMAITSDSALWGWGSGILLEDGIKTTSFAPVRIMENVVAVSAGLWYTMVIKNDGSLWAWGDNWFGQLGDGTREYRIYPVKIMENVASVSTRSWDGHFNPGWGWSVTHTLAVKNDGTLWAWGSNNYGQLGYCTADFFRYEDDGFVGEISTIPHPVKIIGR